MSFLKNKELDKAFDKHISAAFQKKSALHWTPVSVAEKAAKWLGENPASKVLDIGSGVGKFCICGAKVSEAHFTGVEIRKSLIEEAKLIASKKKLINVSFLHQNVTTLDFSAYNAFYFYNPFGEQVAIADWVDENLSFSEKKLNEYENFIFEQFTTLPKGTRVATYYSPNFYLPNSYFPKEILEDGTLVFWEKTT